MTDYRKICINSPIVASETIEQETVIINFDSGMYYSTNAVGARIWLLISAGTSHAIIVDHLTRLYDGDLDLISQAVHLFLNELQEQSLILFTDDALPSTEEQMPLAIDRAPFIAPTLNKYTDMAELLLLDPVHEIEDRWTVT